MEEKDNNLRKETYRIDFHVHSNYSENTTSSLDDLYAKAREMGMGKLVITDHNTIDGALKLKEKYPDYVIVGEEILTTEGEVLAFFVQRAVPKRLTPIETVRRLADQNAFISLSHPTVIGGMGWSVDRIEDMRQYLDAIEIGNARSFRMWNKKAAGIAKTLNIPGTAGSDAHTLSEFGIMGLELPEFSTADELRSVIKEASVFGHISSMKSRLPSYLNVFTKRFIKHSI